MTACLRALVGFVIALAALVHARPVRAAPTTVDPVAEAALGDRELAAAKVSALPEERVAHARAAAEHFAASALSGGSWKSAAGAAEANLLAGSPPLASAWYWLASDTSDYSDAYLVWQRRALDDIFASRATITFQYSEPPKSLAIDGRELPEIALERAIAVDPGEHAVVASSESGSTFRGKVGVRAEEVGRTKFFSVRFARGGGPPEDEVGKGVQYPRGPSEEGMSVLQIVNVVATVTLATGIAVGGSYLLYGTENPRGFGSPEGVAVIVTELSLIAAGTVIAIVGD